MNRDGFIAYIDANFSISGEAYRLINNILDFVKSTYSDKDEQYKALYELLDNTIGLEDNEIKQIRL